MDFFTKDELIDALTQALLVPDLPEISQTVLNLAEFMEHCDRGIKLYYTHVSYKPTCFHGFSIQPRVMKNVLSIGPLPLDPDKLGEQAMRCRAFAKALHYKEDEFHKNKTTRVLESLISINNKLGQKEAAVGLLEYGRKNLHGDLKVQER